MKRLLLILAFALCASANPTFNALLTAGFSPFNYDSNVGQWIAADQETGYSNGSAVGTANDWSGNNRDFTSSGSSRPTYTTSAVNGLPAFDFDGTDDWMSAGDVLDMGTGSLTLMIVMKKDVVVGAAGQGVVCKSFAGATTGRWWASYDSSNSYGAVEQTGASVVVTTDPTTSTAWHVWTIVWERGVTLRIYRDGTLQDSDSFTDNTTNFNTAYYLLLGAYNNGTDGLTPEASTYLDGKVAEFVIWTSALGTTAREGAEDALGAKYGITITH